MKKEYTYEDLLMWQATKTNEIAVHIQKSKNKTIEINNKKVPIWYLLAMLTNVNMLLAKHLKDNTIVIKIDLDFEEINNQFKK